MPPTAAIPILSEDELASMLAEAAELSALDPRRGPLPAILDTGFIRTGLEHQLKRDKLPASVWGAQDESLRLFMEYDTLIETDEKLPKFAGQLGVTVPDLRRILNRDWLPNVEVVRLPPAMRELDPRALLVRDRDVPVPPSKWQAANATLPSGVWAAAKISRGDCFDVAAAGADWELFCASSVFGYGDIRVGPARFQKVVRRTAPNDLALVIQQARHLLTSCCLLCAYDYVRGPDNHPTVPYWRAAFFTKLLYFADSSRHALILDNQVAWIVQQLSTMSFLGRRGQSRAWTTYRYAVYLHWMHLVAAKLDVPTDALEYALFGEARRQRPKLRRRGRPRTSLAGHVPVRAGAR